MTYRETWDLTTIPDQPLYAEVGRRNAGRRKSVGRNGGRPRKLTACPQCGQHFSARDMREHARTHR